MDNKEQINRFIEESLNSTDGMERATSKPFLLTRIHAKLAGSSQSRWEKAASFIGRPAISFLFFCLIIAINILAIIHHNNLAAQTEQALQTGDELSGSTASIYETDNP